MSSKKAELILLAKSNGDSKSASRKLSFVSKCYGPRNRPLTIIQIKAPIQLIKIISNSL